MQSVGVIKGLTIGGEREGGGHTLHTYQGECIERRICP